MKKITRWNRPRLCGALALFVLSLPRIAATEAHRQNDTSPSDQVIRDENGLSLEEQVKEAFESAKRSLEVYNDAKSKLVLVSETIADERSGLDRKVSQVQNLYETIGKRKDSIDAGIRALNAKQIRALKKKVAILLEREEQRRGRQQERKDFLLAKQKRDNAKKRKKNKKSAQKYAVKKDDLEKIINVEEILSSSGSALETWFAGLVNQEISSFKNELGEAVKEATFWEEAGATVEEDFPGEEEVDCTGASLADSVPMVQDSLIKYSQDKIGIQDHLQNATIVHHFTSDTYKPDLPPRYQLENQWWFQYIPDDIERLIEAVVPSWRQWNVALPDWITHTFGLKDIGSTAPPEAVLSRNIHPGSCWPMAGHTGQVTFRLPYPVFVSAVTLDHVSVLVVDNVEKRNSAPKKVRVLGYPPCWVASKYSSRSNTDDDYLDDIGKATHEVKGDKTVGKCEDGLDFDVQKPVLLRKFRYDLDGPSIQTFLIAENEDPGHDDEEEVDPDAGTCSGTSAAACGPGDWEVGGVLPELSPEKRMEYLEDGVVAIRLEILENYGNADYTCIYRFRVHGDAVLV